MPGRRVDVFFYGLFMDSDILKDGGINAVDPRRAYVDDYALRIGQRATLVPDSGARAYGMLFALTHDDLDRLYGAPGLECYRPEAVSVHAMEGGSCSALCYNLREPPNLDEASAEYASQLREVLTGLEFPLSYIQSLASLSN